MKNHIALVSATEKELAPFLQYLNVEAAPHSFQTFHLHGLQIDILFSGIGILQTTYTLMDYLSHRHPDLWIQAGIGGAFDPQLELERVYHIESEMLSGFGAEAPDGHIMDPFRLGWSDPDAYPYTGGILQGDYSPCLQVEKASGMTTFLSHGNKEHIELLRSGTHGQVENMEGAAFFYISLIRRIPFLSLRSISNLVEVRDTSRWKMEPAIRNLNQLLIEMLEHASFRAAELIRPLSR